MEEVVLYLANAPPPVLIGGLTGLITAMVAGIILVYRTGQHIKWLEGLNKFLSQMGRYTQLEPALAAAAEMAVRLNDAGIALIYLQDTPDSPLVLKQTWPESFNRAPSYVDEPAWSKPPVHHAHTYCPGSLDLLDISSTDHAGQFAIVIVPISAGPRVQGYLVLIWDKPTFPVTAPQTCISIGEHLGVLIENFWMYESLRAQAASLDTSIADLRQREKARMALMRGVLHDLRNPLQLVRGFLATALQSPAIPQEEARGLRTAQGAAARAIELAETLLQIEVPERHQLESHPVDVASVVNEVTTQAAAKAGAMGVSLLVDVPSELPAVLADRQALYRILDNLILNAIRHTAGGGQIIIQADYQDEKVRVRITDTGRGMPDDELQQMLHSPLGEAPSQGRLGLWIVRHLISRMEGDLQGSSRSGEGLSLRFTLPAAKQPQIQEVPT